MLLICIRDAFFWRGPLLGIPGKSGAPLRPEKRRCVQIGAGGEWKNDVLPDFRADRKIQRQFPGKGALLWILERPTGLDREIVNRLHMGGRSTARAIFD